MPDPYDHSGLNFASYRGRKAQLQRILGNLKNKTTPDQVSVVGSRHFGKSVLLRRLYEEFATLGSRFNVVIWWDLKADTPTTNAQFFDCLARKLDEQLSGTGLTQYGEYLKPGSAELGENLRVVFQLLGERELKLLLFLDGFDHLAREPLISRNLWDFLRALAQDGTLFYVIASRRGLREAIPDREGRNSEFWNIFAAMEVIKPLEAADLPEWLVPLEERGPLLDDSAKKELLNWTGGVPLLVSRICTALSRSELSGTVGKQEIDRLCKEVSEDPWVQEHLEQLWDDCSQAVQGDLTDLALDHSACRNLATPRQRALAARGYLASESAGYRPSCRFMLEFAASQQVRQRDLRELVKDEDTTLQTMKSLLRLQLASIPAGAGFDDLRGFVEHAVDGLARGPRTALIALRSIADEALTLTWEAEFPDGLIPAAVQQHLTLGKSQGGGGLASDVLGHLGDKNARRTILRAMSGVQGTPKVSRRATRPLMLLIDQVTSQGNYGQHMTDIPADQETPADIGFCVSACWASVELLRRAKADLS